MNRKYCFTVNNEARLFYIGLEVLYETNKGHIQYICGQLEKASTGQIHFQGYVQLKRSQRLTWLKNNIDDTAHFEVQKAPQNIDAKEYCMKAETREEEFIEFGIFVKGKGARSDLNKFRVAVKEGKTKKELMDEHYAIFARYRHFYSTLSEMYGPPKEGKDILVSLYYGTTGTGKTRRAVAFDGFWKKPIGDFKWFSGYDKHKVALFDDFKGEVKLSYLLQYLDRYPIYVENKGGHCWFHPDHIIVTTNYHPRAWYNWEDREVSYKALARRFTEVIEFTETEQSPIEVDEFFEDKDLWPVQYFKDDEMRNSQN